MAQSPKKVTIRTYQVGFGDCFLLSFGYAQSGKESAKHILVDFGTTKLPPTAPKTRMMDIARDIQKRTGGSLHAVVATHRHQDHISGFATAAGGKGTGDVIRALKPKYVVQPWTEDPDIPTDATGPRKTAKPSSNGKHIAMLQDMHAVAQESLMIGRHARYLDKSVSGQLSFLGEDNIKNPEAVANLMTMAADKKNRLYLKAGDAAKFDQDLGIKVHVLGPPTVDQWAEVAQERTNDPDEFWQLRRASASFWRFRGAAAASVSAHKRGKGKDAKPPPLFPRHVRSRGPSFPVETRWLVHHARTMQADQQLQIVRELDDAMNNTSVILLFEIGNTRLLFPGDAQIENWHYALKDKANQKLLAGVNLYKVGHHGSRNATPKSLWKLFGNRSTDKNNKKRLASLMSTLEGKHGSEENHSEVPRETLVTELERDTNLFSTQLLTDPKTFFHDSVLTF
jgi:hypothetical protein